VSAAPGAFRTRVGHGANKRLEDLKGPWVKQVEGMVHDLADSMVADHDHLAEANGPIPALQEPLTPERLAALHLPEWFVRGNQEPDQQAALDYWRKRYSEPNDANPAAAGPKGGYLFGKQMAQLWTNPKYRAIAFASMPADLRDELVAALQSGAHQGHAYTYADGKRQRIEAEGNMDDYLGATDGDH
jgi:hypothetical protein